MMADQVVANSGHRDRKAGSILWIGRMRFFTDLRIRESELLLRFARGRKVFALDRSDATGWHTRRLVEKLRLRAGMALSPWDQIERAGITHFRMPIAVATGPVMNRVAACVNERMIEKALERFGCDTVFHSNQFLFMPKAPGRRSYYSHFDLVDNFLDPWPDTIVGRSRMRFLHEAVRRADSISTISHTLCDRVEEKLGRRPAYVPNGVALDEIRAWPPARAAAVRARHSLDGKIALTYIGNHMAEFDGMELLLDSFLEARKRRPDLSLVLVGPGSDRVPRARGVGLAEGVHIVGPVPIDQVWDYFHAADLGLLPFVLDPGTHSALPLKVLEFGGAGKPMLATPLIELQRLALPHVRFAPQDREAWRRALLNDATFEKPDPARLAEALKPFCWEVAGKALATAMGL